MKIIIAPDSFKGSVTASEAAIAISKGVKRYLPGAETILIPVADGGEGTIDCLIAGNGGEMVHAVVTGPLASKVNAGYGVLPTDSIAVIEMAIASGITLVTDEEKDPLRTTTYGVGELIGIALDAGYRKFILGIGGSATNDGGAGMLQALGMRLLDEDAEIVPWGGGSLDRIVSIEDSGWDARIAESQFVIASDVLNPMIGPQGASHVFGPQKGATLEIAEKLDENMTNWADVIEAKTGLHLHDYPGAGAAGGLGGAFLAFFPAELKRGIDVVIEYSSLRRHLPNADLVITGEGKMDSQTASGKTPMGIAEEAKKYNVPTVALTGTIGEEIERLYEVGIQSIHSIVSGPMSLQEAMERAPELLELASEQLMRSIYVKGFL